MAKKWVYLFTEVEQAEKYVGGDWEDVRCAARRQGREPGRDDPHQAAGAPRLYRHDRSLQRLPGRTARSSPKACGIRSWRRCTRSKRVTGKKFGDAGNPLLVSCRSGAKFSMPGMMDTVLNIGLTDVTVEGLAKLTENPRFAWDAYRRLIQGFGAVVLDIPDEAFEEALEQIKQRVGRQRRCGPDRRATQRAGRRVPGDRAGAQRASTSRRTRSSSCAWPPRPCSGAGTASAPIDYRNATRHPARPGHRRQHRDHGVRQHGQHLRHRRGLHPQPEHRREGRLRRVPDQRPGRGRRRRHPHAEEGRGDGRGPARSIPAVPATSAASSRSTTRTCRTSSSPSSAASSGCCRPATASARRRGRQDRRGHGERGPDHEARSAIMRVTPDQVNTLLHPQFDAEGQEGGRAEGKFLAKGVNASPGAAVGQVYFDADTAEVKAKEGPGGHHGPPVHQAGRRARHDRRQGYPDQRGRRHQPRGRGCPPVRQALRGRRQRHQDRPRSPHDDRPTAWSSRKATGSAWTARTGEVFVGQIPTVAPEFEEQKDLITLLEWADEVAAEAGQPQAGRRLPDAAA